MNVVLRPMDISAIKVRGFFSISITGCRYGLRMPDGGGKTIHRPNGWHFPDRSCCRRSKKFQKWTSIVSRVQHGCQRSSMLLRECSEDFPCGAKKIERNLFNAADVSRWVDNCQRDHTNCRVQCSTQFDLKVIDCLDVSIVERDPNWPYLALSYVWSKIRSTHHPRSIYNAHVPRVIRDDMSVIQRLGYRFLWVDR
jgi:hypothetical protein